MAPARPARGTPPRRLRSFPRRRRGPSLQRRRLSQRQRLPSRESLAGPVPVVNLFLAELPAEEDDLAAALGGEVQQPFLQRLHLRAYGVDALSTVRDRGRLVL